MAVFINATTETFEKMFDNKVFVFKKRSSTFVPDELAKFVKSEMKEFGIFQYDSVKKAKDQEDDALRSYLDWLYQRRSYYNSWKDEQKRHGITLADDSVQSKKVNMLIAELEERFNIKQLHEDASFKNAAALDIMVEEKEHAINLDELLAEESVEQAVVEKKKAGRPKKTEEVNV